jgi:hypothetical protein
MTLKRLVFGERSLTKVAGLYASRRQAAAAARHLRETGALDAPQIMLVGPPDGASYAGPAFSRKLEPEPLGIWRTLIRAHIFGGLAGVALGVVLYLSLVLSDNAAILSSPASSLVAIVFFNALLGLLLGGLLSLRPDHLRVIGAVRRAIQQGRWAIVVHPLNQRQADLALSELRDRSYRVVRSL